MDLKTIVDCHAHSNFSPDSDMSPEEAIIAAIKMGLGGITLTDHVDLDYPNKSLQLSFDYTSRSDLVGIVRQKFQDKLKVLLGIELGFQSQVATASANLVHSHNFDLVINSTHVVDSVDVCHRPLNSALTKEEVYHRYLSTIFDSVTNFDDFDVVGHIGFISRYVSYKDRALRYTDHTDILDMILKTVIQKNKGLEVNTRGYAYNLGEPHPGFDILKRYKELGGTILTIGSDAHAPKQIGDQFPVVLHKLASLGFEYITYFENRKPIFVPLYPSIKSTA